MILTCFLKYFKTLIIIFSYLSFGLLHIPWKVCFGYVHFYKGNKYLFNLVETDWSYNILCQVWKNNPNSIGMSEHRLALPIRIRLTIETVCALHLQTLQWAPGGEKWSTGTDHHCATLRKDWLLTKEWSCDCQLTSLTGLQWATNRTKYKDAQSLTHWAYQGLSDQVLLDRSVLVLKGAKDAALWRWICAFVWVFFFTIPILPEELTKVFLWFIPLEGGYFLVIFAIFFVIPSGWNVVEIGWKLSHVQYDQVFGLQKTPAPISTRLMDPLCNFVFPVYVQIV